MLSIALPLNVQTQLARICPEGASRVRVHTVEINVAFLIGGILLNLVSEFVLHCESLFGPAQLVALKVVLFVQVARLLILFVDELPVLSYRVQIFLTVQTSSLSVRVISLEIRNERSLLGLLIIVVLSKVRLVLMMMLSHLRNQSLKVLFTLLRPNDVLVKFIRLDFHNNLRDHPFKVKSSV